MQLKFDERQVVSDFLSHEFTN